MKSSHYRLLGLVGEGQFGRVYTAIHRQTGELVALKELNPQKFSTKNFLREIRILLSLEHPNIILCQGVEHSSQGRYLVTEYCEGGNLRNLIDSGNLLSLEEKIKIVADILAGLSHAHNEGIIHRDIKPENILLNLNHQGWQGKISDFGVAKIIKEEKDSGNFSLGDTGSPAYMSPEQFYGKYTHLSDLYAVGIILTELLTGDRPFTGTPQEIMLGHLNKTPVIPEYIPESLQTIVAKSLQKLPQHRFRTASEMRQSLLNSISDLDHHKIKSFPVVSTPAISLDLIKKIDLEREDKFIVSQQKNIFLASDLEINYVNYNFAKQEKKVNLFGWNKINMSQLIVDINNPGNNIVITTQKQSLNNDYQIINIYPENKSLINLSAHGNLVYTIAPNLQWLAFVKQESRETRGFQIVNLNTLKPVNLLIEDFLPSQLLALDNHHGLAIYHQPEINQNLTSFRIFTRRGTWADSYIFSLNLTQVTVNNFNNNYFLSQEKLTTNMILIQINPLKLTRIPLKFLPQFIISLPEQFLCANQAGEISLINLAGECLGYIQLPVKIQAINYLTNNLIAILTNSATNSATNSELHFYLIN